MAHTHPVYRHILGKRLLPERVPQASLDPGASAPKHVTFAIWPPGGKQLLLYQSKKCWLALHPQIKIYGTRGGKTRQFTNRGSRQTLYTEDNYLIIIRPPENVYEFSMQAFREKTRAPKYSGFSSVKAPIDDSNPRPQGRILERGQSGHTPKPVKFCIILPHFGLFSSTKRNVFVQFSRLLSVSHRSNAANTHSNGHIFQTSD